MITKITAGLLAITLLAACQSTQTAAKRTTLREMYAAGNTNASSYDSNEPAPPAEGPEAVGAGPNDPVRNPALVPSPLLRSNAAGGP